MRNRDRVTETLDRLQYLVEQVGAIDEDIKKKQKGKGMDEKVEEKKEEAVEEVEEIEEITIDEFAKMKLRLAQIIKCEDHPKADELLVLTLDFGDEVRQVVSGIKEFYKAEDLVGKKVVAVVNLKPVKLRGIESKGMILAAEDSEGKLSLLTTLEDLEIGATVS